MNGIRSTPQYSFNIGLKDFKKEGYDVNVSKLNDNMIGMKSVNMLGKNKTIENVCYSDLSYLVFLKRKRTGIV